MSGSSSKWSRGSVFVAVAVLASACTSHASRDDNAHAQAAAPSTATDVVPQAAPSSSPKVVQAPVTVAQIAKPVSGDACDRLCVTALTLHCQGEDLASCMSHCREGFKLETCRDPMEAFLRCASERPREDWECDSETGASVRDGICTAEQNAVLSCVSAVGHT